MQKDINKKPSLTEGAQEKPNFTRPVWGNTDMSCDECRYNDQDIDTFPCAKCHTRH